MKTLLRILLGLLALLVIIVIIGLFLPSKIHVERSLLINVPRKVLFDQVNNLRNWEKWSPWHRIDTAMEITYEGNIGGTGASYSWKSDNKNVGYGKLTILASYPPDSILTEMDFMEQGTATAIYKFQKTDSGTLVIWKYETDMGKNPFTKYFGLMTVKFVGRDFEQGLKNLDSIAEKLPPYVADVVKLNSFNYVSIRQDCSMENISPIMAKSYDKLMNYIQAAGATMAGAPFAIYHKISDNGIIDLEMGIPVNSVLSSKSNILSGTYPETKDAMLEYYGFYDSIGAAHGYVQDWIMRMGLTLNGAPMEQYVTDPSAEPDTAKWLTRIYYPVK